MKKILFIALLLTIIIQSQAQTFPTKVQPFIWLRADILTNNPNQWKNYNDSIYHGLSHGNIGLPDTTTFNFHQAFEIDSGRPPFKVSDFYPAKDDQYTIITVYQTSDTNTEYGLWSMQLDSSKNIKLSSTKIKNTVSYIKYSNMGSSAPNINSSTQSWRRINIDSNLCSFKLAGTDSFGFQGKFAEFIVFNNRLERIDNEKVHTYLALKHGIGIYDLNYVNSQDSILWNHDNDSVYKYDIVGLGRDDSLGVYQKQTAAEGGNSQLTMYFDTLQHMNNDNNTQISNMNLALYGHNDKDINVFSLDSNNLLGFPNLMNRKWKIALNGNTIHQKAFNIRMYAPNIDTTLTLKLIINRQADGIFDPAMCTLLNSSSSDTFGFYYFNNIYWDTDFSGEDIFTFSQLPIVSNQRIINYNTNITEEDDAIEQKLTYKLYPNPSNGEFTLEITATNRTPFTLTIVDAAGKRVWQNEYGGKLDYKIEQSISNSGNYLINLNSISVNESIKIIIK